ncbi:DUF6206 family protein [Streptomyces naganishii]|uniref:Uncharacterized protein n=1 Tax=Streptomyces naganishii JCM 4654 TaxID=1306179 RepID=A0A918Y3U9_9ACTN|nr:DUF6206 family protein [Streptomyces naganishii]GHD88855.1 hypothetical protein GCM10010508_26600 [Streptomyces naganishii JCM 4654]
MPFAIPVRELEALEDAVTEALRTADDRALTVLGYGEVTLVLRLDTAHGSFACKRLPVFPTRERFERHQRLVDDYITRLEKGGMKVAETVPWHRALPSGKVVAYCVQQALPAERLCSRLLHTAGDDWREGFFERLLDRIEGAMMPRLGLDGQAANWIDTGGELVYVDVTTPLIRDERDRELLDVPLFFTSLPWLLRDVVRVSMTKSIFDKFYEPRGVVLDFLGNLHKERLGHLVPRFIEQANTRLDKPFTAEEVRAYYRDDARMWELIQRLRKADRFVHRKVLRRPYPFLLPPDVAR